jgi:hypothetical protein
MFEWLKLNGNIGFCALIIFVGCSISLFVDKIIGITLIGIGIILGCIIIKPELEEHWMRINSTKRRFGL